LVVCEIVARVANPAHSLANRQHHHGVGDSHHRLADHHATRSRDPVIERQANAQLFRRDLLDPELEVPDPWPEIATGRELRLGRP
jgi:hypothetical protein